jgi:hypothetical protein
LWMHLDNNLSYLCRLHIEVYISIYCKLPIERLDWIFKWKFVEKSRIAYFLLIFFF